MRALRRIVVAAVGSAVLGGLVVAGTTAPAQAVLAPSSRVWSYGTVYGTVTNVVDGDTVDVKIQGDSSTVGAVSIRNNGIQATEKGQCHYSEAKAAMSKLTYGKTVRLTTKYVTESSLGRPVRYVDVWNGTTWVDVQTALLTAGHGMYLDIGADTTRWRQHSLASQQARAKGIQLWDKDYCGSGPSQSTPLRVWVNFDGDGDENLNPNTEYIRVLNTSSTALSLSGWWLRSGGPTLYKFPSTAKVPAKGYVTLRVGKGTNTTTTFYWGFSAPYYPNTNGAIARGEGAYLFDPQGDVRASAIYPCLTGCTDPLMSKVAMSVDPKGWDTNRPESVTLWPSTTASIDLSYKVLQVGGSTYEIAKGTVLSPGEKLKVWIAKGTNSRLNQYWQRTGYLLPDAGGSMRLRSTEDVRITCRAWGTGTC